ncbi:MAG: ferrochelatase [Burkholderiales bacterium]
MNGILLVNLGTPAAPTPEAVRRYLAEFLADPRVVQLPRWLWLPILHGIVLRTRPAKSAAKYAAIWTPQGSPLAVHTRQQALLLGKMLAERSIKVAYAMRYGEPSVAEGLKKLQGCNITVVPLYPQFSRSTTESVRDLLPGGVRMIEQFHDHPAYIAALAALVQRHWAAHGKAKLIMSFHGLPRRAVDQGDPYQAQCAATAKILAGSLRVAPADYQVTYQSRFGAAEWLQPYTAPTLVELARRGERRVDVVCPGFVSDCLETLEEIGIEARQAFLAAGGKEFHALPCLNEAPEWIVALGQIASAKFDAFSAA